MRKSYLSPLAFFTIAQGLHGANSFVPASAPPHDLQKSVPSSTTKTTLYATFSIDPTSGTHGATSNQKRKRRRSNKYQIEKKTSQQSHNATHNSLGLETWRIFGVEVHPDEYIPQQYHDGASSSSSADTLRCKKERADKLFLTKPVILAVMKRLGLKAKSQDWNPDNLPPQISAIRVVRRSLDARKRRLKQQGDGPRYVFVLDVDLQARYVDELNLKPQSGRQEPHINAGANTITNTNTNTGSDTSSPEQSLPEKKRVIIVGAGPAGLFCALTLARTGLVSPILLERGLPVESRGKSIGALINRRSMDSESNFAFGEGGAGTWSDGKLTTRIGRNSDAVRFVLETLVKYGAPEDILVHGSPHLGTDNLVRLLRAMRLDLRQLGGEVIFGAKMTELVIEEGVTKGVKIVKTPAIERNVDLVENGAASLSIGFEGETTIFGDAVVLATGHSARDVYEKLHENGVQLEAKGFAVGFRVEHPQKLINKIQYGTEWGQAVITGKKSTDSVNKHYLESNIDTNTAGRDHKGRLPVPSYRLATDAANDGAVDRGVYSFCMCPGGQIVPASTEPDEVCVNGMSFSRRDSAFANSALVVTVDPDDSILDKYRKEHGVLAGLAFQRDMERRASIMGGGNLTVPVQRLPDFIAGRASTSAPLSSYRLGVKPSACHEIYPIKLVNAMRDAVVNHFERQMPGFLCDEGMLHGVETRTSSPVRVSRNKETLEAIGIKNLFPAGEGAGFAGGIVSAAVDGMVVGDALLEDLVGSGAKGTVKLNVKSVGFEY